MDEKKIKYCSANSFLLATAFSAINIVFSQNQEAVDAIVISSYSDLAVKLNAASNSSLVLFDVDNVLNCLVFISYFLIFAKYL